jgi:hypothetical protein
MPLLESIGIYSSEAGWFISITKAVRFMKQNVYDNIPSRFRKLFTSTTFLCVSIYKLTSSDCATCLNLVQKRGPWFFFSIELYDSYLPYDELYCILNRFIMAVDKISFTGCNSKIALFPRLDTSVQSTSLRVRNRKFQQLNGHTVNTLRGKLMHHW